MRCNSSHEMISEKRALTWYSMSSWSRSMLSLVVADLWGPHSS
jgi:hypothetical protein